MGGGGTTSWTTPTPTAACPAKTWPKPGGGRAGAIEGTQQRVGRVEASAQAAADDAAAQADAVGSRNGAGQAKKSASGV